MVSVYWSILHKHEMKKCEGFPERRIHACIVHAAPAICTIINFLITDIVVVSSHAKALPVFGAIYSYINYRQTLAAGEPVYWFLSWEDYTSVLAVSGLTLVGVLTFLVFAKISHAIKRSSGQVKQD